MLAEIKSYHCQEKLTTGHVHHAAVLPETLLALSNTPRPVPLQGALFLSNYNIEDFSSSVQFPNERSHASAKLDLLLLGEASEQASLPLLLKSCETFWIVSKHLLTLAQKTHNSIPPINTCVDSCRADTCTCSAIPFLPVGHFPMTSAVTLS